MEQVSNTTHLQPRSGNYDETYAGRERKRQRIGFGGKKKVSTSLLNRIAFFKPQNTVKTLHKHLNAVQL